MASFFIFKIIVLILLALAGNFKYETKAAVKVDFIGGRADIIFSNYMSPLGKFNATSILLYRSSTSLAAKPRQSILKSILLKNSTKNNRYWILILILLSGDVELNPGPTKYPCGICQKACRWGQNAIACDSCGEWYHTSCAFLSNKHYKILANSSLSWCCL